ncbi:MAG TPA: RiPP maturation radical SAM C-methyltransferase [Candidatus Angelobacter sp.]|jgi:ribosomal peptide maturation radical SAM protein 1
MYKISLINMPFANLWFPSIALTQLKAVLEEQFRDLVSVKILYLNQDIGKYLGPGLYSYISSSLETNMAAMGDWLFRDIAFSGLPENVDAYFQRCFPGNDPNTLSKKQLIIRKRQGLESFLEQLIVQYQLDEDDLVGFTSMFCQNVASFALARKIKDRNPRVIIALGGANCEHPMGGELVRNVEPIDYVFSGPALKSFPQFIQVCLDGDLQKREEIKGVFSKRSHHQGPSGIEALGEELGINHYIPLDYGSFLDCLERNFNGDISPVLLFETSRGCWWGQKAHCTFCGLNGGTMSYRAMEPAKAIQLLNELFVYAPRCSHFDAVDNILPKSYLTDVLPHINPPENTEIFYEVKADLSAADVGTLAKAHVTRIQPGVESLVTSTLKLMKKGTTAFQNVALLKNCLIHSIHPDWNLLIGFPGETEEVFKKYLADIPLVVHLPPPSGAFQVRFDRYSPYFMQATQYGLDLHPSDFYSFIYPFSDESLHNMAYYFSDHNYSAAYIRAVSEWSWKIREKVAQWRSRWDVESAQLRPKLQWVRGEGAANVICDSRSGNEVVHQLNANDTRLLKHLTIPRKMGDLATTLSPMDVEGGIYNLQQRGLIFEEDKRYLSLVIPNREEQSEQTPMPLKMLKALLEDQLVNVPKTAHEDH